MSTWISLSETFIPAVGWIDAALFLGAYVMVSQGRLQASSLLYQGLNITGAVGLAMFNGSHNALPSATLNLIWICIGVYIVMTRCRHQ